MTSIRGMSRYDRETLALALIATLSLAGLGICWWLG
jgi:hypothetical protein